MDQRIGICSPERTIADAFRLRGEVGYELAREGLREWLRQVANPAQLIDIPSIYADAVPGLAGIGDAESRASDAAFPRIQSVASSAVAKGGRDRSTDTGIPDPAHPRIVFQLTRTSHAGYFVLKGGVLLTSYGAPPKNAEAIVVRTQVPSISPTLCGTSPSTSTTGWFSVLAQVHAQTSLRFTRG